MDDASLSEHEQRILQEIERNLAEEDPDFVRQVSEVRPPKDAVKLLRVGILGLILGFGLLLGYTTHVALGALGFLIMLAGAVAVGTGLRGVASGGRTPGSAFRTAIRRAEGRMRPRRRDQ